MLTTKVLYEELCPTEFLQRLEQAPIAYLPLGTLEWHGPHLPLGADGIQSQNLFKKLAHNIGGIVLPSLFLGPDRFYHDPNHDFFGMDINTGGTLCEYTMQQLPGSSYWIPDSLYHSLILNIASQLARAGFKILVAHGHGPSTLQFASFINEIENLYDLHCYTCWDPNSTSNIKFQGDHAAANETSITMAFRPELVQLERITKEHEIPKGIAGKDPTIYSSVDYGNEIIDSTIAMMSQILGKALKEL